MRKSSKAQIHILVKTTFWTSWHVLYVINNLRDWQHSGKARCGIVLFIFWLLFVKIFYDFFGPPLRTYYSTYALRDTDSKNTCSKIRIFEKIISTNWRTDYVTVSLSSHINDFLAFYLFQAPVQDFSTEWMNTLVEDLIEMYLSAHFLLC